VSAREIDPVSVVGVAAKVGPEVAEVAEVAEVVDAVDVDAETVNPALQDWTLRAGIRQESALLGVKCAALPEGALAGFTSSGQSHDNRTHTLHHQARRRRKKCNRADLRAL
ncbi:MAG: hypothetical protein LH632_12910, partial [Rhodoferax sp.]|nr:hypothetical protein [Rhodoferax sp.]